MWKFSNPNSSCVFWPPDAAQQQKRTPFFYPSYANNNGCLSVSDGDAFPGLGAAHGGCLHLNSAVTQQLNPGTLDPANGSARANGCSGLGFTTHTKRFLIFDHSGDRTNLIFRSVGNPQPVVNPTPPPANEIRASDCREPSEEDEEMHEDTEEIDALLYSDTENSLDSEEASTGHSPPGMGFEEDEEECTSPVPPKRRKLEHPELDASPADTASSAVVPCHRSPIEDDGASLSCADSGSKPRQNPGCRIGCGKRERIQATVNLLRRIVPGGKGKGAVAVLDDAIRYLKSLKIQAEVLDGGGCAWMK